MRFDSVRERLDTFPVQLPPPPASIDARVIGQADRLPDWITSARGASTRRAAGLCLLFPDSDGEAHIVLTERPAGDLRHAGQISLPGGAEDPGDEFPIGTALREAREEIGLATDSVEIAGVLGVVDVRVSGFLLTPVIGVVDQLPALTPDRREVASIVLAPIEAFLPDAPVVTVEADRDGFRLRYGAYVVQGHHVWGATARVMGQLGALLASPPEESAG